MQSTFFTRSNSYNTYLLNTDTKCIHLVHPYLPFIYFNSKERVNEISKEDQEYYSRKLSYYKKHNIISEDTLISEKEQFLLTRKTVEDAIANTSQLVFETTEQCNLKCKYCIYGEYYSKNTSRVSKKMPELLATTVIDYLSDKQSSNLNKSLNNTLHISFYGGEPLMNESLMSRSIDYIKNGKFENRKIRYSMTTNGTLIDKNIELLTQNNIHLLVSLDGNESNNEYRVYANQQNSFAKIMSNINSLQNNYPDYFEHNVNFNAVLHNKNSVESLYNFFQDNYNKRPNISELNNSGILDEKKEEFALSYRNKSESLHQSENYSDIEKEMFIEAPSYNSVVTFLHQYLQFIYRSYEDLLIGNKRKKVIATGTCIPFAKKMFLTVDGKILPCERISHKYALGKVNEKGVDIDIENVVEKYNTYYKSLYKQCSSCYRHDSCIQCVFYLDNLDEKPVCHGHMNAREFANYVSNNISFLEEKSEDYFRIMKEVVIN